jgi:hypothetical protein
MASANMLQNVYACQGIFKTARKLVYIADQNQRERAKGVPFWVSGAVLGLVRRVAVRLDRRYGIRSRPKSDWRAVCASGACDCQDFGPAR